ncbi:hypothetical protein [Vibrio harveyi]|uniref:hypothetical protein n=1 Tax=Vibrio harveyi TaxID=669 RepID=UPI00390AACA8
MNLELTYEEAVRLIKSVYKHDHYSLSQEYPDYTITILPQGEPSKASKRDNLDDLLDKTIYNFKHAETEEEFSSRIKDLREVVKANPQWFSRHGDSVDLRKVAFGGQRHCKGWYLASVTSPDAELSS